MKLYGIPTYVVARMTIDEALSRGIADEVGQADRTIREAKARTFKMRWLLDERRRDDGQP